MGEVCLCLEKSHAELRVIRGRGPVIHEIGNRRRALVSRGLQRSRVVGLLEYSSWRPSTMWSLGSYGETECLAVKR